MTNKHRYELGQALAYIVIGLIITIVATLSIVTAQDSKPAPVSALATQPKAITLTQPEKQPFIEIINRLDLLLTQKQLIDSRIEVDQLKFQAAVEQLKKARSCTDCGFDAQKLELVPPLPKVEPKIEPKAPTAVKP